MGMFSSITGGGGSAKRAAAVAAQGQQNARNFINQQYATSSGYYQPYQEAGTAALGSYQNIAATLPEYTDKINAISDSYSGQIDPVMAKIQSDNLNDFTTSPGYEFRMKEGQRALEASRAASGMLNSGATGKELMEYGQGIGSAEYQTYLGGLYNQLGAINTNFGTQIGGVQAGQQSAQGSLDAYGNLINYGYNAANQNANLGMNAAYAVGDTYTNEANAYASGMQAKAGQLQSSGDFFINQVTGGMEDAAAFLTGGMVQPNSTPLNGSTVGQQQFGGQVQMQPYGQPQAVAPIQQGYNNTAGNSYMPTSGSTWTDPNSAVYGAPINSQQQQAQLSMQSGYKPPQITYLS